tara:strand:- start:545 stop:775 length:231 start_codon:yes stop_codon:yes gene_type:complete
VYVPPGNGLAEPYTADDAVENHADPANVRLNLDVLPTITLAPLYADIPDTDIFVTVVLPVHAIVSVRLGEELKDVG